MEFDWFLDLFAQGSVAGEVFIICMAVAAGMALGKVSVRGLRLGVGGALFAGLVLGHFHLAPEAAVLHFAREFGLILFVYAIGLQVGPAFFESLEKQGLRLNLLALLLVTLGTLTAVAVGVLSGLPTEVYTGLLSGAVTNTPSLGAAQQTLLDQRVGEGAVELAGLAYATAYPLAIVGIISSLIFLRRVFKVDLKAELAAFDQETHGSDTQQVDGVIEISNHGLEGRTLGQLMEMVGEDLTFVSIRRQGAVQMAVPDFVLTRGDILEVCGPEVRVKALERFGGRMVHATGLEEGQVQSRRIVVSNKVVVRKTLAQLGLHRSLGLVALRITRAGLELRPKPELRLRFGDRLDFVGTAEGLERARRVLGDSLDSLEHTKIIPIFLGICVGIVLGCIPFYIPAIPAPVKLGLATGPLVVAIIQARLGRIGPMLVHVPHSANELLKDLGIAMFLSCVGLKSGERFTEVFAQGDGWLWMGLGFAITVLPVLVIGVVARKIFKLNFVWIMGLVSGGMTDPPALAYANEMAGNDSPSVAYATVYPMTMLLRVMAIQLVIILVLGS